MANRLIAANRSYFGLKVRLSHSYFLRRQVLIYRTLVRPVLAHAAETWTTTKNDERRPSIFERKIFRRMYGPICERERAVAEGIEQRSRTALQ
jgi:hypothetical protein